MDTQKIPETLYILNWFDLFPWTRQRILSFKKPVVIRLLVRLVPLRQHRPQNMMIGMLHLNLLMNPARLKRRTLLANVFWIDLFFHYSLGISAELSAKHIMHGWSVYFHSIAGGWCRFETGSYSCSDWSCGCSACWCFQQSPSKDPTGAFSMFFSASFLAFSTSA